LKCLEPDTESVSNTDTALTHIALKKAEVLSYSLFEFWEAYLTPKTYAALTLQIEDVSGA